VSFEEETHRRVTFFSVMFMSGNVSKEYQHARASLMPACATPLLIGHAP